MKYGFPPRPEELQTKLDKLDAVFRLQVANMCKLYEIVEDLRAASMWDDPSKMEYSTAALQEDRHSWLRPKLIVRTYNFPLDIIINELCSIIHQKYGVDWKLRVAEGLLILHTEIDEPRLGIDIHVSEGSNKTCEIIKEVSRTYDPFIEYKYKMDCSSMMNEDISKTA